MTCSWCRAWAGAAGRSARRAMRDTELLPHDDLRLLAAFEATEEWVLEPGDILYVPPRVAHNGIAVGDDCMTYSIGFRAPSRSELISHYADDVLERLQDDDRYADPDLPRQGNPGEITARAVDRLHAMITEAMNDRDAFVRWFGGYTSTPKYPEVDWGPERAGRGGGVARNAGGRRASRIAIRRAAFHSCGRWARPCCCSSNGACFDCAKETAAFAELLCGQDRVEVDPVLRRPEARDGADHDVVQSRQRAVRG